MKLALVLRKWRLHNELTVKALAAEIKISAATLCRIEEGRQVDGATLMKVFNWLCSTDRGGK